jgi:DNA-binding GntR family transcriptional regulator
VVAALNEEEIEECVPISEAIEELTGQLACEHISEAEIAEIKALHRRMAAEHGKRHRAGFISATRQIHEKIVAATRNALLGTIYDTVYFRLGWNGLMKELSESEATQVLEDHRQIVEALEARQGGKVSDALRAYLAHIIEARRLEGRQARH